MLFLFLSIQKMFDLLDYLTLIKVCCIRSNQLFRKNDYHRINFPPSESKRKKNEKNSKERDVELFPRRYLERARPSSDQVRRDPRSCGSHLIKPP